jgi:hypothetical protein
VLTLSGGAEVADRDTGRLYVGSENEVMELDLLHDKRWVWRMPSEVSGMTAAADGVRLFVVHVSYAAELDTRTGTVTALWSPPRQQRSEGAAGPLQLTCGMGAAVDRATVALFFCDQTSNVIFRLSGIRP